MQSTILPSLYLKDWKDTRDTLHKYCRLVGAIRETLAKPLPYSLHTNLLFCRRGFTTSLISKNVSSSDNTFEIIIDLIHRKLCIESNYREPQYIALTGQSLNALCDETCSLLTDIGVKTLLDGPSFLDGVRGHFEAEPVKTYWKIVRIVNRLLIVIKKNLHGKTSPIQLRPDDFSVILNWFGKTKSKANDILAEQVEFGFSTGYENIFESFFYVSTFPKSEILNEFYDHESLVCNYNNLNVAILPFSKIIDYKSTEKTILDFFRKILPLISSKA